MSNLSSDHADIRPSNVTESPSGSRSSSAEDLEHETPQKAHSLSDPVAVARTPAPIAKPFLAFGDSNFWLASGTWALVVVTGALAYFALATYGEGQKSFERAQRAWLSPIDTEVDGPVVGGQPLALKTRLINSGHEPAQSFSSLFNPVSLPDDSAIGKVSWHARTNADHCLAIKETTWQQVIFPASTGSEPTVHRGVVPASYIDEAFIQGRSKLIVEQCYIYRTANGMHHTAACSQIRNLPRGVEIKSCPVGNVAD